MFGPVGDSKPSIAKKNSADGEYFRLLKNDENYGYSGNIRNNENNENKENKENNENIIEINRINGNNGGANGVKCFAETAKVQVLNLTTRQVIDSLVKDIKVNDLVKTINGFSKVVYIFKSTDDSVKTLIQLTHENGTISLSSYHLIYAAKSQNKINNTNNTNDIIFKPTFGGDLKIGDILQYIEHSTDNKKVIKHSKIIDIKLIKEKARSIITQSGELVVNNIRISSYSGSTNWHFLTYFNLWDNAFQFRSTTLGHKLLDILYYFQPKFDQTQ